MRSSFVAPAAILTPLLLAGALGAAEPQVTFSRDVAPILYKHCATCHRKGEIAPMSLLTYEEARPWAKSIRDKVGEGAMPPWHADPAHGRFKNDRRLSPQEKDVLVRWAAGGAAKGDPKDLPPLPRFAEGWTIGEPDAVVSPPAAFSIPDDGQVPYQYFEVPTGFTEDRWIRPSRCGPATARSFTTCWCSAASPTPSRESWRSAR
jgi:hypothetical protein